MTRIPRQATPVVLITGLDDLAMSAAAMTLQLDLPDAVTVRHHLDPTTRQLHRTISDLTGVLEREVLHLEHACASCAIREDVVPTLTRLADLERWGALVAHLPIAAEAEHVCRVLPIDGASDVQVAAVVMAVDGPSMIQVFTGDALLDEVGLATSESDRRGLAETAGTLAEYADVIRVTGEASPAALDLLRALARPGAVVVRDDQAVSAEDVLAGLHDEARSREWSSEVRSGRVMTPASPHVWQLDLRSPRPFHPDRLRARLEDIGGGPHRSRGCFWLPTRPGVICGWQGAGGQLSIGSIGHWAAAPAMTRLVITGLTALSSPSERTAILSAFEDALLTADEMTVPDHHWLRRGDGFAPWLGESRRSA